MNWEIILKRDSPLTDVDMIKEHLTETLKYEKKSMLENIGSGGFLEKDNYPEPSIAININVDDYNAKVDTFEKRVFEGSGDVTFTYTRTKESGADGADGVEELDKETIKGTFTIQGKIKAPFEGRSNFSEKDITLGKMTLEADIDSNTSETPKQYFSTDEKIEENILRILKRVYEDTLYKYFKYYIDDIDVKARGKLSFGTDIDARPLYGFKGRREKNPRRSKQGKWQDVIAESSPDDDAEYKQVENEENNRVLGLTKKKAELLAEPNIRGLLPRYQLDGEFSMGMGEVRYSIEEVYDKEHEKSGLLINDGKGEYYQNLYASFHHPNKQLNKKERKQWVNEFRAFKDMPAKRIYSMIANNEGK